MQFPSHRYFIIPPYLDSFWCDEILRNTALTAWPDHSHSLPHSTTCSILLLKKLLTKYSMYRPSISIQYDVLSLPLPLFSTAPQSFSVNETTARPILLNNITCAGTETRLTDCPRSGVGTHNCSHTHNVVVSCRGAYHYIMLKTTHSCRMRIEHSYIYVHNIFDVCMGQHDPFSPTSKLKVTICY